MGIGGGAASASLVWGLWGFTRWPRTSGKEHPIIAECCAYADYDGWLVTTMDKRRLPRLPFALAYTSGWYPEETTPESTGRWTHQTATLSFLNPQADATFSLDYAARVPQAVTVSVGDQLLQSFVADASGRRRRQRIPLPAAARRCCTARSKSLTSLCRLQSHPAQYVSGIPSAAILLSISHPIRCSTRCLANVRVRISGPMIAL